MILFGYQIRTAAKPLPVSGEAASITVNLIDSAPGSETDVQASAQPTPMPASSPQPIPTPEPVPTAIPEPACAPMDAPVLQLAPMPQQPVASPSPRENMAHSAPNNKKSTTTNISKTVSTTPGGPTGNHGAGESPLPRTTSNPKPDYPPEAIYARHEGVVIIAVEVSAEGRPTAVSLARSSGFPELDHSALRTLWRWRFDPARRLGLAVASHVNIPVRFHLEQ